MRDFSKEVLEAVVSIQFLGGMVVAVFAAGIIWNDLNRAISANESKLATSADSFTQVKSAVTELQSQTRVILVNQTNAVKQLETLSNEVKQIRTESTNERRIQQEDIKKILHLLNER